MSDELKFKVTGDTKEGQAELAKLSNSASATFRKFSEEGKSSTKIVREAFTTLTSEVIEGWGVDGDIANELSKMFVKMPKPAIAAGVAIAGSFVAAAAGVGVVIASAKEMIELAEEIGTKSKEDFDKLAESMKLAGYEVTALDRVMSQDLTKSVKEVKAATDGLFLTLIRESGPELTFLLRNVADLLEDLKPAAEEFGEALADAFNLASSAIKNPKSTGKSFLQDLGNLPGQFNRLIGVDKIFGGPSFVDPSDPTSANTPFGLTLSQAQQAADQAVKKLREEQDKRGESGLTGFDSKGKGPDRKAARERAQEELQKMLNEARTDSVRNLKDIDLLRFATDDYIKSIDAEISRQKAFMALNESQAKRFNELAKQGMATVAAMRDVQFETAEIELNRLSMFYGNESVIIQARAELDRQSEIDRFEAVKNQIAQQLEANKTTIRDDEATAAQKLLNQQLLNQRLEEEQRRHKAQIDAIDRGEKVKLEEADPTSARNTLGGGTADALSRETEKLGRTLTIVEKLKVALKQFVIEAQKEVPKLGNVFAQMARSVPDSLATLVSSFVSGRSTIRQAAAAFYAAALQPLVDFLNKKAAAEFALALASIAAGDYVGAAKHTAAGIGLSAAAGLIGGGASLIAGNGAAGSGGGALGNAVASNAAANQETETRYRFVERNGSGIPQGDVLFVVLESDEAQRVKNYERMTLQSYRSGGAQRQTLDNAIGGIPLTTGG